MSIERPASGALLLTCLVAGVVVAPDVRAGEADPPEKRVAISFRRAGSAVTMTVKPTDTHAYINTLFPISCELRSEGGVNKAKVGKADFKIEDSGLPGKATSLFITVTAANKLRSTCRLVACTSAACSLPFTLEGVE